MIQCTKCDTAAFSYSRRKFIIKKFKISTYSN